MLFDSKGAKVILVAAGSIVFVVLLVVTFKISWKYFESEREESYTSVGDEFPVVVNTEGKSELIFIKDLKSYTQKHPDYSFLIPNGKETQINRQFEADQEKRHGKGTPKITAYPLADGRQLIQFEIWGDGLLRSRYEASEKEVQPLNVTALGPLFPMLPLAVTVVAGFAEFLVVGFVVWLLKRKRSIDLV